MPFKGATETTGQIAADQLSGAIWAYQGKKKPSWGASDEWRFPAKERRDWKLVAVVDGVVDVHKTLASEEVTIDAFKISEEQEHHILGGDVIKARSKVQRDRCLELLLTLPPGKVRFRVGGRELGLKTTRTTCPVKNQIDTGQVVHTPPRPPNRLGPGGQGSAMASRQLFAGDPIHA